MSHVRTQIRSALKTRFSSIPRLTGLANRVVADHSEVKSASDDPLIEVVVGNEQVEPRSMGTRTAGRHLQRQVRLSAWVHTRGGAEAIEDHETITAQLEATVFADPQLGGLLFTRMTLESIQLSEPERSGSKPQHSALITWVATYITTEADATVANPH